jgi:peptidoglycan/xylan/chitin deacetylase (PgdA/CDA1 family)
VSSDRAPFYRELLASSGGWIALVASALFLLMLATLFGPFEACGAGATPGFPPRIGFWVPASAPPERVARTRDAWRAAAPAGAQWIESTSLDELASVDVAVVAHARRLGSGELAGLARHLARGGSVVMTGAIAVRGPDDAWVGWDAMRAFLGVERVTPLAREQSFFLAAGPRSALTAGLDPGQRLALAAEEGVPAIDDPDAPLYWSSFGLEPIGSASAAARTEQRGDGRLVWLAAGPEYAADAVTVGAMTRVAGAALAWAGRLPFGEIAAWPDAAPFAALLAMDTEQSFENAAAVAEIARRDALPITFLALSNEAVKHPALTAELASVGEVGSHGDDHTGFEGQPAEVQRERIARARRDLEALGVPPLRGFRPPLLSYDDTTLALASSNHFEYILGNHRFDRLVPTFTSPANGAGSLVQIAHIVRDDVDLIVRERIETPEAIAAEALADAQRIARVGGLYYFSFHSHLLAAPQRIAALPEIARGLRSNGAWLAGGAELADWWRARAGLAVDLRRTGPRRVALSAANEGSRSTGRAVLRIHLQRPIATASLRATTAVQAVRERWLDPAAPELRFARGDASIDLALPPIAPGRRVAWDLDWASVLD